VGRRIADQLVELGERVLVARAEATCVVEAGVQVLLHHLGDADVFVGHLFAVLDNAFDIDRIVGEEVLEDQIGVTLPHRQPSLDGHAARKDVEREQRVEVAPHAAPRHAIATGCGVDVPPRIALSFDPVAERLHLLAHCRVDEREMVALEEVVVVDLPVHCGAANGAAVEHVPVGGVGLALGRESTEPLDQVGGRRVEADEDETAPGLGPDLGEARTLRRLGTEVTSVDQCAFFVERPAVVAADEVCLVAGALPHDGAGAVRTHVVERTQDTVVAALDEDRPAGEILGDVVARALELVVVGDHDPVLGKDLMPLDLPDGGIGVIPSRKGLSQAHRDQFSEPIPRSRRRGCRQGRPTVCCWTISVP